ncbi:hypothetical protein KR222_004404 [Zaprionus bogoriensis]|nr:hypothetical protein KR222_004404 [Zaprionus bogoriensis]
MLPGQTTTTTTSTTTKRVIWLAIICVIVLLPLGTNEARRSSSSSRDLCKGSDGDDAADCVAASGRRLAARRAKFKFHKLQRLEEDNDEHDTDNGSDEDDGIDKADEDDGENEQDESGHKADTNDDNDEDGPDDDDDDDDDDEGGDNDDDDDDDEAADAEDEDDDDDDDDEEENADADAAADADEEEPSLLDRIMRIFSGGDDNEQQAMPAEKESAFQLPDIISWLQSLTEQAGDAAPAAKKEKQKAHKAPKSDVDWLTYLKRWPFNSIFPEPAAVPVPPKRSSAARQQSSGKSATTAGSKPAKRSASQSDEYLELLIHSLPAFFGTVSQAQSGECHQQLELLHRQLRAHKLWTLQMLDATGKIGAGLLRGNINQFGDFEQCTGVSTSVKDAPGKATRVYGKYCLAQIEMRATQPDLKEALHLLHGRGLWHAHLKNPKHFAPRYSIANWGICLPHACSAHVVHSIIETSLRPYNATGIEFHIDVRDEHCATRQRKSFAKRLSKDNNLAMGIFGLATLACTCLLAIVWEHWDWLCAKLLRTGDSDTVAPDDETERTEDIAAEEEQEVEAETAPIEPALHLRLLQAFSPQRTLQSLLSLEQPDIEFPLIHLLKILATLMIYVNLKFIMAGHLPLTNRDAFVNAVNGYGSLAYRVPLLYSDLLLLLSGFLVAHKLSHDMETTCRLSFLRNVATKAGRHVPSILVVLGFQTWVLPHLGAGPLWRLLVGENARLCEQNMWRSALSVQNTGDLEEMCSPLLVQVSLDMQLYFLGALVIWLYFTDPEAGFFLCGAFHAVSVAARYSRTQREHLAPSLFHGIHVSKFYRTANLIYTSPVARATAYLLGIGAGLLHRSESGSFAMAPRFKRAGWALALLAIGWCFWAPATSMRSRFVYKSADAAAYLAWSPLILGLGVCWSILMAPWDKLAVQRFPNIARPLLLLSRIEIPLQLASYVVVLWNTASVKEPQQFQTMDLFDLQELVCIVCFALLVVLLVDAPAQQIGQLILEFNFSDPLLPPTAKEPPAEDAPVEGRVDTPEPIESIWSSDTDAEEEKSSG